MVKNHRIKKGEIYMKERRVMAYTFITEHTDFYFHKLQDLILHLKEIKDFGEIFMSLVSINQMDQDDFEIIKNIGKVNIKLAI